jgi:hypothetical protein
MADFKEQSTTLRFASNLGELHQKHIQCSEQLSNNAIQISNMGKQHLKTVQHAGFPSTDHLDKHGKILQKCLLRPMKDHLRSLAG